MSNLRPLFWSEVLEGTCSRPPHICWPCFLSSLMVRKSLKYFWVMNTDVHPTCCIDSHCKVNKIMEAAVDNNFCREFYQTLNIQSKLVSSCELLISFYRLINVKRFCTCKILCERKIPIKTRSAEDPQHWWHNKGYAET